jgi:hypothetical protein
MTPEPILSSRRVGVGKFAIEEGSLGVKLQRPRRRGFTRRVRSRCEVSGGGWSTLSYQAGGVARVLATERQGDGQGLADIARDLCQTALPGRRSRLT